MKIGNAGEIESIYRVFFNSATCDEDKAVLTLLYECKWTLLSVRHQLNVSWKFKLKMRAKATASVSSSPLFHDDSLKVNACFEMIMTLIKLTESSI